MKISIGNVKSQIVEISKKIRTRPFIDNTVKPFVNNTIQQTNTFLNNTSAQIQTTAVNQYNNASSFAKNKALPFYKNNETAILLTTGAVPFAWLGVDAIDGGINDKKQ